MADLMRTAMQAVMARRIVRAESLARAVSKEIGPIGAIGPQGERGFNGEAGSRGERGDIGPQGSQGETGPQGAQGQEGVRGERGEPGPRGDQGDIGPVGAAGAKGEKGDAGPQGETGKAPAHEWQGTKLRFKKPDGKWGKSVDLKGEAGDNGKVVVMRSSGGSSGGGMSDLIPGNPNVEPTGIAVSQAGQWVNLSWPAFIQTIAGAIDMASELSRRSDFVGETIIYRGEAVPGAAESAAVWRIKRIEFITGVDGKSDIDEKWAAGSAGFTNVWSDRAILGYA